MADAEPTPHEPEPTDPAADASAAGPVVFTCPGCGEELAVETESLGELVVCSYCNTRFFASADVAGQAVVDDTDPAEAVAEAERRESELNALKIRQITSLRRSTFRARSWCIVGLVVCVAAAGELIRKTVENVRHEHRWGARPSGFVLFAVAALLVGWSLWKKIVSLTNEMRESMQHEPPDEEPDFSTLGDGSSRWKNLEDVR